ncbi:inner centromere protein B isoform X2 [Cryptotermes secundus]|nr:inner centromere protein B isoform X2 [Cryptotermes secundus]
MMNRVTLNRILGNINQECQAKVDEVRGSFKENLQWLSEISSEIEKFTTKSAFLLPKTPSVKRKLRKRGPIVPIPEGEEVKVVTSEKVVSPHTSCEMRVLRTRSTHTRGTLQSSEMVSPVISKRSTRRAFKDAGKKITEQINMSLITKMRQSIDGGPSHETQVKKHVSSGVIVEDDQLPRKNRRFDVKESALLGDKAVNSKAEDVNVESRLLPQVKRLRMDSITDTISAKRNKNEQVIVLDSPDCVSSSVNDECLESLKVQQKSPTSEFGDTAATSTVKLATSPKEISSVLDDVAVKFADSVEPMKSVCSSPVQEVDSLTSDEPQADRSCIRSPPDVLNGKNKNKSHIVRSNSVHGEKGTELSPCVAEGHCDMISEEVQEKLSEKEISVNEKDKIGNNVTFTKDSEKLERNDVSARFVNVTEAVDQPNSETEAVPEQLAMSHSRPTLRSSATKMVTTQKSVFRPFANEPVRERVAAFERLRTVSEEPVELVLPKQPEQTMRVTRTKTRAMVKAAAESAHTNQEVVTASTEVPQNSHAEMWKASRKSVAKAKKICVARECREKEKIEEFELSKENSMSSFSASKFTTPYGLYNYEKYRKTPLSSSNISNTSANSGSRAFPVGSLSKGHYLVNKQPGNLVVGLDSFLTKQAVKPTLDDIREMKEEEMKRRREKEEEARKKREQKVKEKVEEKRRKREEKMQKVLKAREALEKQKQDAELRIQREKEEKLKQVMQDREERIKEQVQQKKQHAQKKAAEIEERRKQEEAARLAKLKEQEEEQRRLQAERKKEQEDAERQHLQRLAEEKEAAAFREQQALAVAQMQAKLLKEKQAKEKTEAKGKGVPSKAAVMDKTFDMLPSSANVSQAKKAVIPDVDDYGIDSSGASSEDDERPKRPIPFWATNFFLVSEAERMKVLKIQAWKRQKIYDAYFGSAEKTPNLTMMFGVKCVKRTSSAVWRTPPRYSTLPKY